MIVGRPILLHHAIAVCATEVEDVVRILFEERKVVVHRLRDVFVDDLRILPAPLRVEVGIGDDIRGLAVSRGQDRWVERSRFGCLQPPAAPLICIGMSVTAMRFFSSNCSCSRVSFEANSAGAGWILRNRFIKGESERRLQSLLTD